MWLLATVACQQQNRLEGLAQALLADALQMLVPTCLQVLCELAKRDEALAQRHLCYVQFPHMHVCEQQAAGLYLQEHSAELPAAFRSAALLGLVKAVQ